MMDTENRSENNIECFKIPIRSMVKSVGPRLVPFFKSIAVFFILYGESASPTILYALVKSAPMVSLIAFVLLNGTGFSNQYYMYSRRILSGLIASLLGDIFLVLRVYGFIYFVLGVISFAAAHCVYAVAFGFQPFNAPALAIIGGMFTSVFMYVSMDIDISYVVLGLFYSILLTLMVWRGVSRLQLFDDLWTWTKLCSCVGAILFGISDCLLAFEMFILPDSTPWIHTLVMATYYASQLGMALSVVDSQVDEFLHCSIRYKYTLKEENK